MTSELKLILVAPDSSLCEAFRHAFASLPNVEIVFGRFENLPQFDCMVSAANSFGLMDGGVDLAIVRYFGRSLMEAVQKRILSEYIGEQPVGTSFIVETHHSKHPFVAHTPTMRVPMDISDTDNAYRAMWAMLLAVHHHNQQTDSRINVLACSGLGTGTGGMPYAEAAGQMSLAYRNFLEQPRSLDWEFAEGRQNQVDLRMAVGNDRGRILAIDLLTPLRTVKMYLQKLDRDYRERLDPTGVDHLTRALNAFVRIETMLRELSHRGSG